MLTLHTDRIFNRSYLRTGHNADDDLPDLCLGDRAAGNFEIDLDDIDEEVAS